MNNKDRSTQVFKTLLKSFKLQKNALTGEINRLLKTIHDKKQLIIKFEDYNREYQDRLHEKNTHNMATYINDENFLNKIAEVLFNEQDNLKKFEEKKISLKEQYNKLAHKIDKIETLLEEIKIGQLSELEKKIDSELSELAVNRNIYKDIKE